MIRALSRGMPLLARDPRGLDRRSACLYGAWLCGLVLGTTGTALHHKLCHVLGGSWNLPHAETHTILLPHAVAYNYAAAPEAMKRIERAMGTSNAAVGKLGLIDQLNAPRALKDIGMNHDDLERAASLVMQAPYYNPRSADRDSILSLLNDAFLERGREAAISTRGRPRFVRGEGGADEQ